MKNETKKFLEKKIEELQLSGYCMDFIDDYSCVDGYVCDLISEFADSKTSIYYSDQRNFYFNNSDDCMDAINSYYGGLADFVEAVQPDDLDELICKAGASGEYIAIESELNDNLSDLLIGLAINYLLINDVELTIEQVDEILDQIDINIDRVDEIRDIIEEVIS